MIEVQPVRIKEELLPKRTAAFCVSVVAFVLSASYFDHHDSVMSLDITNRLDSLRVIYRDFSESLQGLSDSNFTEFQLKGSVSR